MFTFKVGEQIRKLLASQETATPSHVSTKPWLEILEDRTVPSVSDATSLPFVSVASPPAAPQGATVPSLLVTIVEQRVQVLVTLEQDVSSFLNAESQAISQAVSALEQRLGSIFGINPNPITASSSPTDSGAGRGNSRGSGSGSGATATGNESGTGLGNIATKPMTGGGRTNGTGSGGGGGGGSTNASVTGQIWLDNNADGSIDENEMDYSGAHVLLLYQVNSGGGITWSTLASTTTSNRQEGNNYSMGVMVPPGNSYTCEIDVAIPLNFGDETYGELNDIDAQGFSPVFSLSAGDTHVVGAALNSMNVNTLTEDPNGVLLQDTMTLRDAINSGNNGPPFPAVTFSGTPSGTITLQKELPHIEKSYNINGPGPSQLTIQGSGNAGSPYRIFTIDPGVTSTILGLTITGGYLTTDSGAGIKNFGTLTLVSDVVTNNQTASGSGGGIYNNSKLTLEFSSITDNKALEGSGGGIQNAGTSPTVLCDASGIIGNTALNGGGIANTGSVAKVQLLNCSDINSNGAQGGLGGGIYVNGGTVSMTGKNSGSIASNIASTAGGGAYVVGGLLTLNHVSVDGNSVLHGNGGGIDNAGTGAVTMVSLSISNNIATSGQGGGIYNGAGALSLSQVYIGPTNKASTGGGAYIAAGTTTTLTNVTVKGNTATVQAPGVYWQNGANPANPPGPPALTDKDDPGQKPVQGP